MIYRRFIIALAREKVSLDNDSLTAQLVKGYIPDDTDDLSAIRPYFVSIEEDVSGRRWDGAVLHVDDVPFLDHRVETDQVDGVVFLLDDMPMCYMPVEADEPGEDEIGLVKNLTFPEGLLTLT